MNVRPIVVLFLISLPLWGDNLKQEPTPVPTKKEAASPKKYSQVRAWGQHQCQSRTSIGYTCTVTGIFSDCNEAFYSLKRQDCCGSSKDRGNSIGFAITSCSSLGIGGGGSGGIVREKDPAPTNAPTPAPPKSPR